MSGGQSHPVQCQNLVVGGLWEGGDVIMLTMVVNRVPFVNTMQSS